MKGFLSWLFYHVNEGWCRLIAQHFEVSESSLKVKQEHCLQNFNFVTIIVFPKWHTCTQLPYYTDTTEIKP